MVYFFDLYRTLCTGARGTARRGTWGGVGARTGNIAGDNSKYRDEVLSHGALDILLEVCKDQVKMTMLKNATWTLSNFCRGKAPRQGKE